MEETDDDGQNILMIVGSHWCFHRALPKPYNYMKPLFGRNATALYNIDNEGRSVLHHVVISSGPFRAEQKRLIEYLIRNNVYSGDADEVYHNNFPLLYLISNTPAICSITVTQETQSIFSSRPEPKPRLKISMATRSCVD